MKQFWNERYAQEAYAYGTEPNAFFKNTLGKLSPGKLLLPAEGEGRNGVYAAMHGWEVSAFDQSEEGKRKADMLAENRGVRFDYKVGILEDMPFESGYFDVIGLIYAHFPAEVKEAYHRAFNSLLKPGGYIVFEAFSKGNLEYLRENPAIGGPRDAAMLFSKEELQHYFPDYEFELLSEDEVFLHEGLFHQGKGLVIRMLARKKS
ncbi:class I SAM-dependent methyltransferase [Lunatimonas salinarum]|uniref:class I SAM-dependent methyltransferase n=1 Tax=Lunatimonas salinarum TaxID=1774590 RepID=UPI001AE04CDF|nr:class I SAM-dependent methyltransferase [Lunatimonas salinarum]